LQTPTEAPFDPLQFLELARELGKSDDQSKLRTAVGRAYYAVFLITRDKLSVVAGEKTHKEVFDTLYRRRKFTIRDQLMTLYDLRQIADYNMDPENDHCKNWKNNWVRQEKLADVLLPQIQRL